MKHFKTPCHVALMRSLAEARLAADLSQRELAARLNRSTSFCFLVETGQRSIGVCEAIEWMQACRADTRKLIGKIAAVSAAGKRPAPPSVRGKQGRAA